MSAPSLRGAGRTDRVTFLLLVLVTAVVVELVRSSGPLLDHAFAGGVLTAALTALATYAAPGLFVVMIAARLEITGRVVLLAVSALVVVRLALQWLGSAVAGGADLGLVRYGVGLAGVALGIAVLVLVAAFASGARPARSTARPGADQHKPAGRSGPRTPTARGTTVALGVGLGALLAAALSGVLGTWDAYWRDDAGAWALTCALCVAAFCCAWQVRDRGALPGARGLWVLGPYLALVVQVLANPAFVASQTGLPLVAAVVALALAGLATAWFLPRAARAGRKGVLGAPWPAPVLLVVVVAATFLAVPRVEGPGTAFGWVLLALLALGVVAAARTVAQCLVRPAVPATWGRLAGAASVVGLGIAIPLLGFQVDYDVPLPFPNGWVPVVAAVALAVPGVVTGRSAPRALDAALATTDRAPRVPLPLAVAGVVAAAAAVALTQVHVPAGPQDVSYAQAPGTLTVLDWNLHYGVSADPSVRLDAMVDTIEGSGADVVTLQEVSRGWVLGGGADMATYLARETGMRYAFVPAADRQFGNAILWDPERGGLDDVALHALPYGQGPQQRSAISGTSTASGTAVRVTSVHLQHRESSTPTRLDQLGVLFEQEPVEGAYLLAGDLNSEPGWPEIRLVEDQGLESGQDVAGDPDALTSPSLAPTYRIDWVFGSVPVTFRSVDVLTVTPSDHRPLLAELRLPG